MDKIKCKERAFSRFETVLRFYWDGVPVPPFVVQKEKNNPRYTFLLRQLGYTPDYYGEVLEVLLEPDRIVRTGFECLCNFSGPTSSMSSRIGSHYSPLVGTFMFRDYEGNAALTLETSKPKKVRLPTARCDGTDDYADSVRWNYQKYLRMTKVLELYEPLVKEHVPLSRDSLRRIVVASTKGLRMSSKEWVVQETCCVNDEYTRWMCESIYYYMCINSLYRKVVAPLQLKIMPDRQHYKMLTLSPEERIMSRLNFVSSKRVLENSLLWGKKTRSYFLALKTLWDKKFNRLVLFDLSTSARLTDACAFFNQVASSMNAALARIRIEFYTSCEDFFYLYIADSKKVLTMSGLEVRTSEFQRIFTATRVFFVNQVRDMVFDNLERILTFFSCNGYGGREITRSIAEKHPQLEVEMIVGDNFQPSSPGFTRLVFGFSDLIDSTIEKVNRLPCVEPVILRTIELDSEPINAISKVELAYYRASLMSIFDGVATTIDEIAATYATYSSLPVQYISIAKKGSMEEVKQHILFLRETLSAIRRATPDIVYCGCIAINCQEVKSKFTEHWEQFQQRFYADLQKVVSTITQAAEVKCVSAQRALRHIPATVAELEQFLEDISVAERLCDRLRNKECKEVVTRVGCMEEAQVPIDHDLYISTLKWMKWPSILQQEIANAEQVKISCRPLLVERLDYLRKVTHDNLKTLSTGVTELYNMFNLEICDIAAQTCNELRALVNEITSTIDNIFKQEKSLGIQSSDLFDEFYPLLNYFETVEQYWTTIYRITNLREFYTAPVSTLNANNVIDSVRECRRFLHSATRNLRAFAALVRLGKQQELVLADFEEQEELLRLVTTPGLRKNHWKEIARLLGSKLSDDVSIVTDASISLQKLIDAGIANFVPELQRIAWQARSDYGVESLLEEMKSLAKKTHFQVMTIPDEHVPRTIVVPECHHAILAMVEGFILGCQRMRRQSGLSSVVVKALSEWETSTEKMRNVLLDWTMVEEKWGSIQAYSLTIKVALANGYQRELSVIGERLATASDAFDSLNNTLCKPQFSLYTAIMQETVTDMLRIANNAVTEASEMLGDTLERMRVVFPRFSFLTDTQLRTFVSVYNIKNLAALLPFMYSRLSNVRVEGGRVVEFITADGAAIPAHVPIPLSAAPTEEWMQTFDRVLAESVFAAIRNCTGDFAEADMDEWVVNYCSQLVLMTLRINHTKDMRKVVRMGGARALTAYKRKLACMREELCRVAGMPTLSAKQHTTVAAAIMYIQHADTEVAHARENISSASELDATAMMQTVMTKDAINVRLLGMSLEYGLEFLGNCDAAVLTPVTLGRMLATLTLVCVGRTTPILCGDCDRSLVEDFIASFLGRLLMRVQCYPSMTVNAVRPFLRGAIASGAVLCLQDCEHLPTHAKDLLVECMSKANDVLHERKDSTAVVLPLGAGGTSVSLSAHPHFHTILSTSFSEEIPRSLSLEFRPLHVPRMNFSEMVSGYLTAYGRTREDSSTVSARFAVMYAQFHEMNPSVFSESNLLALLRHCAQSHNGCNTTDLLCNGFLQFFFSVLQQDTRLRDLLCWHLEHTLCPPSEGNGGPGSHHSFTIIARLNAAVRRSLDQAAECFPNPMVFKSSNVVLTGPPFSGKTTLWRRCIGDAKHTILAPSLMSADDFYGSESKPGFVSVMARVTTVTETHFFVVEDGEVAWPGSCIGWPHFSRIPGSQSSFVMGPSTHIIVSSQRLHRVSPRIASDFVIVSLPAPHDWRQFLLNCLRDDPDRKYVTAAMEVLLPALFKVLKADEVGGEPQCSSTPSPSANNMTEFLAICHRCVSLYRKWHAHTSKHFDTVAVAVGTTAPEIAAMETAERAEGGRLFAAQCAVFSVIWGIGLSLPHDRHDDLVEALLDAEKELAEAMDALGVTDRVLPPLGDVERAQLLSIVSTPLGWRSLRNDDSETIKGGVGSDLGLSWFTFQRINPQLHSFSQVFPLPSRVATLRAVECLLDCAQNVILYGGGRSGRTTLLRSTRHCDRWVSQLVCSNKGLNPAAVQEDMACRLLRRSNGSYGPSMGRKLVVCVDDVHLSTLVREGIPTAARLISFCEKFGAISTPSVGFISTIDTVFFGSSLPMRVNPAVQRAFVPIHLPDFVGAELTCGVRQLFETACAKKRVDVLPRECTSFITVAHAAFVQLQKGASLLSKEQLHAGAEVDVETLVQEAEQDFPVRLHDALCAVEACKQFLVSAVSDVQVSMSTFTTVTDLYGEVLRNGKFPASAPRDYATTLVVGAENTMRGSLRGEVTFSAIAESKETAARGDGGGSGGKRVVTVSTREWAQVSEWINEFEVNADDESEVLLETLYERTAPSPPSTTRPQPVAAARSTLLTYPSYLGESATGGYTGSRIGSIAASSFKRSSGNIACGSGNTTHHRRQSIGRQTSAGPARQPSFRFGGAQGQRKARGSRSQRTSATPMFVAAPHSPHTEHTQTYQTTWLTAYTIRMTKVMQLPEAHAALISQSSFGIHRALRLACSATKVPLALFHYASQPGQSAEYSFSVLKAELRAVVTFACSSTNQTEGRVAVYLPYEALRIPGVARLIDAFISVGDVSDIFSSEERAVLMAGGKSVHQNQRSLRPPLLVDDFDLRRRIRRCICFIVQVNNEAALRQLAQEYPALARMAPFVLHQSPAVDVALRRELASAILLGKVGDAEVTERADVDASDDALTAAAAENELPLLTSGETLVDLVCELFGKVAECKSVTTTEQLLDFAWYVRQLRSKRFREVHHDAYTTRVVSLRGDAATAEIRSDAQRLKQCTKALAATKREIVDLTTTLKAGSDAHQHLVEKAQAAAEALQAEDDAIVKKGQGLHELRSSMERNLTLAATRLRRVKPNFIKAMGAMRLPEKGILLVRAVYKVLGEELPKHNNSSSELWGIGQKMMCTPEFVSRFIALSPVESAASADLGALLTVKQELNEVRYGTAIPFAQGLSDFMVAFIECVRIQVQEITPMEAELVADRETYEAHRVCLQELHAKADRAKEAASATCIAISDLESKCELAVTTQTILADREKRLVRYVGMVDRFAGFINKEEVSTKMTHATCAEGDILLVAAYYALLAMHPDPEGVYQQLTEVLWRHSIPCSPTLKDSVQPLLLTGHTKLVDTIIPSYLPLKHRLAMLALQQRVLWRHWPLFGGVCEVFERALVEYLQSECAGCVAMSAYDPGFKNQMLQAMKDGEGVLLRDVCSQSTFDMVRGFAPLLPKLNSRKTSADVTARVPFEVFGREVEVHPRFFLICTSTAVHPVARAVSLSPWMDVTNLDTPIDKELRYAVYLQLLPSLGKNYNEEFQGKRMRFYQDMHAFMGSYTAACDVLCLDLNHIANDGDADLNSLEAILVDVDASDSQLVQHGIHMSSLRKQQQDLWLTLTAPLLRAAEAMRLIETEKLRRPWDDRLLDVYVRSLSTLSSEMASRLSPQKLDDLPKDQRHFYVVVNFIERVTRCFSCGWPDPLRGVFALLLLTMTVLGSGEVSSQRGVLFARGVQLLSTAQLQVLLALITNHRSHDDGAGAKRSGDTSPATASADVAESGQAASGDGGAAAERQRLFGGPYPSNCSTAERDQMCRAYIMRHFRASGDELLMRLAAAAAAADPSAGAEGGDDTGAASFAEQQCFSPPLALSDANLSFEESISSVAQLFRALIDLDIEQVEVFASRIYSDFFASVKDSNSVMGCLKSGVAIPHNRSEAQPSAVSSGSGNPIKTVSRSNSQYGFSASTTKDSDMAPKPIVHSYVDAFHWSTEHCIPVCVPTDFPDATLKMLRQHAAIRNLRFQWYTVESDMHLADIAYDVLRCAYSRPMHFAGHWFAVHVTPPRRGTSATARLAALRNSLHTMLAVFAGGRLNCASGGGTRRVPVCLTLVVTYAAHGLLWDVETCSRPMYGRFLYLSGGLATPRDHIIWLLRTDAIAYFARETGRTARELIRHTITSPKTGTNQKHKNEFFYDTLREMSFLLGKELVVLHTGMVERQKLVAEEWCSAHYRYHQYTELPPGGMADDDRLLTLFFVMEHTMLMHERGINAMYNAAQQLRRQHREVKLHGDHPPDGGDGKAGDATPHVTSATTPKKSPQAYTLYRNRRPAWQVYRRMLGEEAQAPLALPPSHFLHENALELLTLSKSSSLAQRTEAAAEAIETYMAKTIFTMFQKVSYQIFAGFGLDSEARHALRWMASQTLVAPSISGIVSCGHLARDDQGEESGVTVPLVLEVETTLEQFTEEVVEHPSELVELCGDADAFRAHWRRLAHHARNLFFLGGPLTADGAVVNTEGDVPEKGEKGDEGDAKIMQQLIITLTSMLAAPELEVSAEDVRGEMERGEWFFQDNLETVAWRFEREHLRQLCATLRGQWRRGAPASQADGLPREAIAQNLLVTCNTLLGRISREIPGRGLAVPSLWLPCLQHPQLTVHLVASNLKQQQQQQHGEYVTTPGTVEQLVVVVTLRRLLTAGDVVLSGASLSSQLWRSVRRLTGWTEEQFARGRRDGYVAGSSEDVVVAARVVDADVHFSHIHYQPTVSPGAESLQNLPEYVHPPHLLAKALPHCVTMLESAAADVAAEGVGSDTAAVAVQPVYVAARVLTDPCSFLWRIPPAPQLEPSTTSNQQQQQRSRGHTFNSVTLGAGNMISNTTTPAAAIPTEPTFVTDVALVGPSAPTAKERACRFTDVSLPVVCFSNDITEDHNAAFTRNPLGHYTVASLRLCVAFEAGVGANPHRPSYGEACPAELASQPSLHTTTTDMDEEGEGVFPHHGALGWYVFVE